MTDPQKNWRLLSESFDREFSIEEQNLLEYFITEHESSREFEDFLKRVRDCSLYMESDAEMGSSVKEQLSEQKKIEIQRLLDSAIRKRQDSLSNRDVVFACELVSQGAISLGDLTKKISQWNSDSKPLSKFLKSSSTVPDVDFSNIESQVSETIFAQTLDQTILDTLVTAIKQRVPDDDCTVFDDTSDNPAADEFINLLNKTNSGITGAFESLLDCLRNESRMVIQQARVFSLTLRLKPIVDEVFLRLVGRRKLDLAQLACYYRNVGIAIRKLFESDSELSDCVLRLVGNSQIAVTKVVESLNQMADEEPRFVQIFNLQFFAGLTTQHVANLLELSDQEVSVECGYGVARLLQLANE